MALEVDGVLEDERDRREIYVNINKFHFLFFLWDLWCFVCIVYLGCRGSVMDLETVMRNSVLFEDLRGSS